MDTSALQHGFIFLIAACGIVPLFSRFKLGAVLGYLTAGVLIGPHGFAFITHAEEIMHFAEFGVVMLLFIIGLELEPATLWRMKAKIVGLGGLQVALTTAAFTLLGTAMGYDWRISLCIAMALSLSSTALVMQMIEERGLTHTPTGETAFAILLFQDIAVIPILVLMPLLVLDGTAIDGIPRSANPLIIAIAIAAVIILGRYFSRHMFRFIAGANLRELFTATSLALVVGITLLMNKVGVSPALGAFIAGLVLANSEYKHTLEADIEPFKGLLLGLFFISVGMGMSIPTLAANPGQIMAAVLAIMAIKAFVLFTLARIFGISPVQSLGTALALSQGGEFAFVLFQLATSLHLIDGPQSGFLTLVVALSMALTPLLILAYERYGLPHFMSVLPEFDRIETQNNPVLLAGYGRFGQIIGRYLRAQGIDVTVLEKDPEQIDQLRKFGHVGYYGDASRLDLLRNAGAAEAKLLIIAVDDADACLEIARLAKAEFPSLTIYARARNRRHAFELHKAGVDFFKRETFDSALSMAQEVLVFLGKTRAEAAQKAAQFQRHDEEVLVKSFAFFDEERELIDFSRQSSGELERILRSD